MITWASVILALLKIVNAIMGAVNREQLMQAGADAEIAKVSASILEKTAAGKAIMEKVNGMTDADVDAGLRDLEPK